MIISLYSPFYECRKGKKLSDWAIKDNNKWFQNFYCLDSENRISQPPEAILAYIYYIAKERSGFTKYEVIDIGLDLKRYIISLNEGLLMAVRDQWHLPDRCYDFFTTEKNSDDSDYYS